jgi:hypothetical protein
MEVLKQRGIDLLSETGEDCSEEEKQDTTTDAQDCVSRLKGWRPQAVQSLYQLEGDVPKRGINLEFGRDQERMISQAARTLIS